MSRRRRIFDKVVRLIARIDEGWSYMAQCKCNLEILDRTNLQEQEIPLVATRSPVLLCKPTNLMKQIYPNYSSVDSHVRWVSRSTDLRRSYSYSIGINEQTGQFDAGLIFYRLSKIRTALSKSKPTWARWIKMNEYITHIGSDFACFAGAEKARYLWSSTL